MRDREDGRWRCRTAAIGVVMCALLSAAGNARAGLTDPPPVASLIALAPVSASGETTLTGARGAVSAGSTVIGVSLDTGHYRTATASDSGAFTLAALYAPAGSSVLVKTDPAGRPFDPSGSGLIALAGTVLRVPDPASGDGRVAFGGANLTPGQFPIPWRFEGTLSHRDGEPLVVRGTVILDSPAVDGAGVMTIRPRLSLERLSSADGSATMAQATFASALLTPTGFPIERTPSTYPGAFLPPVTFVKTAPGRAEAAIDVSLALPEFVDDGYYRPLLMVNFAGVPGDAQPARPMLSDLKAVDRASRRGGRSIGAESIYAPVIRVGEPQTPRLPWMLLANDSSEGTRGVQAIEDRHRFAFAPRVATQSDTFIIERTDPHSGATGRVRFEPFLPFVSLGDRELPSPPLVPFRFPSGELRAVVTHPDGRVTEIAPAPFVQARSINAVTPSGRALESGGGYPHDPYQLSTMQPRFELELETDGRFVVRLEGWVEDAWGNRWDGGGTYEVLVANRLVLDTAVLPGTPFEEGNALAASMQIVPGVPAEVEMRVQVHPGSSAEAVHSVVRGRANRFGHFLAESVPLPVRGEYRVDVVATWRDPDGRLWAGSRTWGSAIAPVAPMLQAHGIRGIDDMPAPRPIWFERTTPPGSGHIQMPFLPGDVLWAIDHDAAIPHLTYADPGGVMQALFTRPIALGLQQRYAAGETPPLLMTASGADAHFDANAVDVWSYAYRSIQRPQVRVRELVGEESGIAGYYWRFNSAYGGQRGVGVNGDLPNDIKFQFGAMVVRGAALAEPHYAIYGSLFVLAPGSDPHVSRVFPPFQGNGGGPDGGPLFTLKGREIDLFFHPTGVRPGTILHRGERIAFSGYAAPTLPARIEIVVTSPSGFTRTLSSKANAIGYFFDPLQNLGAHESGLWKARVKIEFDGRTSAGQTTAPFPAGDVLGSRDGEFYFYVVDPSSPQLEVASIVSAASPGHVGALTIPPSARIGLTEDRFFVRPADGPISFTVKKPAGLTDVQLTYTTTMPGFILEERTQTSLKVVFDAQELAKAFPNLDLYDGEGNAGADAITISILLSGTGAGGVRKHVARQIVIQGEELQMPDQRVTPKRRAVR